MAVCLVIFIQCVAQGEVMAQGETPLCLKLAIHTLCHVVGCIKETGDKSEVMQVTTDNNTISPKCLH